MRRTYVLVASVAIVAAVLVDSVAVGQRATDTAAQEGTPDPGSVEAVAQRWYDGFNTGDVAIIDEVLAPDWADYPPPPGPGTDVENYKQVVLATRAAFPDIHFETQDFIVEGDQVVVRSTATGTHEGEFLGIPPTGRVVKFQTIDIHRIADGRIVETYHVEDLLSVLIQVGAFSPAASLVAASPVAATPTS